MTESNGMAFAAIITITLPDSVEATKLNVTLLPSDLIKSGEGSTKPLQDCTLGELLQYAQNLENEIWSGYRESNLLDLVIEGGAEIDFVVSNEDVREEIGQEFWLEHLIVIDEDASIDLKQEGKLGPAEVQPPAVKSVEEESSPVDHVDVTSTQVTEKSADADSIEQKLESGKTIRPAVTELEEDQIIAQADSTSAELVAEELDDLKIEQAKQEVLEEIAEPDAVVAEADLLAEEIEVEEKKQESDTAAISERPHLRIMGRRRPLNHPTWTSVDILINEPAFRNTQAHALSSLDREVAGVLIGPPPEKQPDGRYLVHISDSIIAKHTRMHGASVTYTPESWRYVNDKLAEKYPENEAVIIGWYHTHPGFGIFLSDMDQFIHQNFFTQSWHIALVLDPLARRSGFFCWDRQLSKVDRYEFPWPNWAKNSW